jgi:AbrB family looped-hinge helix DNA binding protein
MDTIRASSKGQIVIPRAIRRALNIRPGTELTVQQLSQSAFTVSLRTQSQAEQVRDLRGLLKRPGRRRALTDAAIERRVVDAVGADDRRVRRAQPRKPR